jgi:hypothetical protein
MAYTTNKTGDLGDGLFIIGFITVMLETTAYSALGVYAFDPKRTKCHSAHLQIKRCKKHQPGCGFQPVP